MLQKLTILLTKEYLMKTLFTILMTLSLLISSEELYKNCAGCHGENGEIAALGVSKTITAQESNLTIKQLTAYKNGELNQYGLGNIMQLQLTQVNEDEIKALANYIANMENKEESK